MYILVDVEACMCRSRGVHVRTAARVQERKYGHVRTYEQGLERLLAHTYMLVDVETRMCRSRGAHVS